MKVTFICGCETGKIINRENIKTMSTVTFDEEGFLICAIHKERRRGWRSVPKHSDMSNVRVKLSYFSYTPLEREAHVVFGDPWPNREVPVSTESRDFRDNRDPKSLTVKTRSMKFPFGVRAIRP